MALYKGKKLSIEIYGESHAPRIGVKVGGMPPCAVDMDQLAAFLARRSANGQVYATARHEADRPIFEGLRDGRVVGDFEAYINNADVRGHDYAYLYGRPRPGHADYAWYAKEGTLDFCGGGRFSGRMTAPLCVAGGIALQYLATLGVRVVAYISRIGPVRGPSYKDAGFVPPQAAPDGPLPALGQVRPMLQAIADAKAEGDSVGGRIECVVLGYPTGIGDNLFEGLEGAIAQLVYAIPAVKGVEFGDGFDLCAMRGSAANDGLYYDAAGQVAFASNHMGGINGGISNGNYMSVGVAIKPTPSIARPQTTVDLATHRTVSISVGGRHDACIVPRAVPVVESAVALALVDQL